MDAVSSLTNSGSKAANAIVPSMAEGFAKLALVDPHCIYIEHVSIAFGVSTHGAKQICNEAVKQGILFRQIQILCPDGSVAAVASSYEDLPDSVKCWHDQNGSFESRMIRTNALCRREIFALRGSGIALSK
jgi:hypothetical protein